MSWLTAVTVTLKGDSWGGVSRRPSSCHLTLLHRLVANDIISKTPAPRNKMLWLHFCIVAGSRDTSSIFIYSLWSVQKVYSIYSYFRFHEQDENDLKRLSIERQSPSPSTVPHATFFSEKNVYSSQRQETVFWSSLNCAMNCTCDVCQFISPQKVLCVKIVKDHLVLCETAQWTTSLVSHNIHHRHQHDAITLLSLCKHS